MIETAYWLLVAAIMLAAIGLAVAGPAAASRG